MQLPELRDNLPVQQHSRGKPWVVVLGSCSIDRQRLVLEGVQQSLDIAFEHTKDVDFGRVLLIECTALRKPVFQRSQSRSQADAARSEERRVGKECRCRRSPE